MGEQEGETNHLALLKSSIARVLCFSSIVVRILVGSTCSQGLTLQYQQHMCSLAPTPFIHT